MYTYTELEKELAELIIDTVKLDDVKPDEIDPEDHLFVEGLELDSIDALDIAMSISRKYGVELRPDDPNNVNIFASLRSLAKYVEENRKL